MEMPTPFTEANWEKARKNFKTGNMIRFYHHLCFKTDYFYGDFYDEEDSKYALVKDSVEKAMKIKQYGLKIEVDATGTTLFLKDFTKQNWESMQEEPSLYEKNTVYIMKHGYDVCQIQGSHPKLKAPYEEIERLVLEYDGDNRFQFFNKYPYIANPR